MTNRKNKRKKVNDTSDDTTSSSYTTLDEEDVIKIIKRLKLDINDLKYPYSILIKSYFNNLKVLLDDLVKNGTVESYDTLGGYRYGYLLINDINIDILVKINKKDDFKIILKYFKNNLGSLHCNLNENRNNERKDYYDINLYMYSNLNTNNNLQSKVLIISFNHKKIKKEFKFKLFFTIVKYDLKNNIRKTNVNEYLIKELDEINSKYTNIPNAIILVKLFLHTFNLSPFPLFIDSNTSNNSNSNNKGKKLLERKFAVSELNGHVFNLIISHMCVVNNYSYDIKAVILFKNTLSYLTNLYKKLNTPKNLNKGEDFVILFCNNTTYTNTSSGNNNTSNNRNDSTKEVENNNLIDDIKHLLLKKELLEYEYGQKLLKYYQQLVVKKHQKKLIMRLEKYPKINLLEQIELVLPQVIYYFDIGLNILNSRYISKNDKMIQLLLRKNMLSNFYENYLTFKCKPEESKYLTEQIVFLLEYGLKERLHLIHYYYICNQYLIYTYDNNSNNISNTDETSNNNNRNTNNSNTNSSNNTNNNYSDDNNEYTKEDYNVMIYFTFNNDVQSSEDFGPSYTPSNLSNTNSNNTNNSNNKQNELERKVLESEFYKLFWGDRSQLVRTNNRIQYSVDLSLLGLFDNNTTNTGGNSNRSNTSNYNQEERLFLDKEEMKGGINLEIINHIEKRLLNKEIFMCLSNFNVKYPLINEQHKALVSTTNDFTDILRNLDESPLKILNTQVLNESYCYCNLYNFYNLYDYFNNSNTTGTNNSIRNNTDNNNMSNTVSEKDLEKKLLERDKVIRILIRWESSNKWPREEEAFNKVVMSLLLTISKELKNRFGLYTMIKEDSLLVFYNNYLYEIIPLNSSNSNMSNTNMVNNTSNNSNINNLLSNTLKGELEKTQLKEELERKYRLMEDCRNAVMTNLNFVGCVRLLKIYFTKYLKLDLEEFSKLLCLQIYNENNYIKSSNSSIQFLQLLFQISNSNSMDEVSFNTNTNSNDSNENSNNTNRSNSNVNNNTNNNYTNFITLLNDNKLFSSSTKESILRYCRTILREVNINLVTLPSGSFENNEEVKERNWFKVVVDNTKLKQLLSNRSNYNMAVKLNNIYHFSKDQNTTSNNTNRNTKINNEISNTSNNNNKQYGLEREYRKYNSRDWIKCMIKYIKNNLNEVSEVYYYKYKVLNYFNTKSYKNLNLYLRFDKFKFVPKLHFKQRNYPQSVVVVSSHLSHLARLKEIDNDGNSNTSNSNNTNTSNNRNDNNNSNISNTNNNYKVRKNNLINTTGYSDFNTEHNFESIVENDCQYAIQNVQETVIIVPNVILIMKMLTMLTSGTLNNIVFL